ncbi:glycosyltransferase family 2 protein, partial [Candidatus Saccharibacteria bacterium]|nr:glycosyltransferase family 2 protein [Candidatus Saccharibacteria bacterium]
MNISENKKVSVIIPNYNYGKYIKKRIDSILRQTYPVYEIIVLDDKSTDGSDELIKNIVLDSKLENPELNIRFIQNRKNSGKAILQWKKGFEEATGEFVWIAEADDLAAPEFLAEVMKGFSDSKVVLSYAESKIINSFGMMIAPDFRWSRDKERTGHYRKSYIKDGAEEIREIMAIRCTIPNVSAVVFRKDKKFLKYLDEAAEFSQAGDWYFYTKVLENGKISYARRALNRFRVHNDSKTGKAKKDKKHYEEILRIHKMLREKYQISEDVLEKMAAE